MIVRAYCYAYKRKKENESNGDVQFKDAPCYFFYYWIEKLVPKETHTSELPDFLGKFYKTLDSTAGENWCKVTYEDPDINTFALRKGVHDFTYDYDKIQNNVKQNGSTRGSEYIGYLNGIDSACRIVSAGCPKEGNSDPYCADFNKEYRVYCEQKVQELRAQLNNPNQAGSSGSFSDADVVSRVSANQWYSDCSLDKLPSRRIYGKFEEEEGEDVVDGEIVCKVDTVETNLTPVLSNYGEMKKYTKKIAKAWCKAISGATEAKGEKKVDNVVYYSLYYWLGGKVWESGRNDKPLPDVMSEIYLALETASHGITRVPTCTENIDQNLFNKMKKVFEYYYDYGTIKDCIQKSQTSESNCIQEYSSYLQEAVTAYNGMEQYCDGKDNVLRRICCKYFNEISNSSGGTNIPKPSELKSELDRIQETAMLEAEAASSTTTPTAPIISSILGLLGIPTLGFYLYKYNLLPPGIKNFFGGGRSSNNFGNRKIRSVRRNFDTLTEYTTENASTIGPTEYSTEHSTVESIDNSTIYNGPSRKERTNNTTDRRKNISYQNM
ncbi:KIR protein [Plasmodium coatneyi]|uniref:KIR protein n=1 Tax=Plasmodium coatneyi TaxID=208452 RepID=A0A1B1E296_9APIC|nr:KIR protein [Plasmodium coatneyi]ANQ09113.1 KIR protein [Plasmodium coatneyi]